MNNSSSNLLFDIEHSRSRLQYYTELKAKPGNEKSASISRWIEIYSERVHKLERQATKLGLKTQLKTDKSAASRTA